MIYSIWVLTVWMSESDWDEAPFSDSVVHVIYLSCVIIAYTIHIWQKLMFTT